MGTESCRYYCSHSTFATKGNGNILNGSNLGSLATAVPSPTQELKGVPPSLDQGLGSSILPFFPWAPRPRLSVGDSGSRKEAEATVKVRVYSLGIGRDEKECVGGDAPQ